MGDLRGGHGPDRLIVGAVGLLIAAFALTALSAFVPFAQADDQLAGNRDSGDVAVAAEDDDDGPLEQANGQSPQTLEAGPEVAMSPV